MTTFLKSLLWLGALLTVAVLLDAAPVNAQVVGAVFVGTNHNNDPDDDVAPNPGSVTAPDEPPNQVARYPRFADGSLGPPTYFDTGGQGSGPSKRFAGDGLGSAHSVQLSRDKRWLFVTNGGSDNISVFRVLPNGLELTDLEPTGDGSPGLRFPNSVAQFGIFVYVLNSGDQGSITGFYLSPQGTLAPIPDSTRFLDANQVYPPDTLFNPTQVSFTPDGRKLVVTIKDGPPAENTGPGRVLVFDVDPGSGRPSGDFAQTDLDNLGPFGFSFDRLGNLITSLFVGGPNLTGAAGSYRIRPDNTLAPISAVVPNGEGDTCWVENNAVFAYTANYGTGTISSYVIGIGGQLTLLQGVAGTTNDLPGPPGKPQGSTPLDIRLSPDGRFLYNVLPGSGAVAAWRINGNGTLTKIGEFGGLPDTVPGDMAPEERFGPGGSPAGIDVL